MVAESIDQFNIHDAKTNLSRLVDRAEHGEEIIISRAGVPVARLTPYTQIVRRTARGSLRGELALPPDWDSDEVNESIARDFGMSS